MVAAAFRPRPHEIATGRPHRFRDCSTSLVHVCLGLLMVAVGRVQADICWILFQTADNNLEAFLRADLTQIVNSGAAKDPTVTTWVYFDSRNLNRTEVDITTPLPDVYSANGSAVTGLKNPGSLYLRYDHNLRKMVISKFVPWEQNSDDPKILFHYLRFALSDCIAQGSTEYFLLFSSHGAGFLGFGGDDNEGEQRRRFLTRNNPAMALAIVSALSNLTGAGGPTILDVLAFNAGLMQSVDALDDYRGIAKYYLASEAVIPGHGYAYDYIDVSDTALGMAQDILNDYVEQRQGKEHQIPKTMSLVNVSSFQEFLPAWDALCAAMNAVLVADNDATFYSHLNRARSLSLAFEGVLDSSGEHKPSHVDIGSFLNNLKTMCVPDTSTQLSTLLDAAMSTYDAMFVARRVGPGTEPATGMQIAWPYRTLYAKMNQYIDSLLLTPGNVFTTASAPNYVAFLKSYFTSGRPATDDGNTCTAAAGDPGADGSLLLNPTAIKNDDGTFSMRTGISIDLDNIEIRVGYDASSLMNNNTETGRRRLRQLIHTAKLCTPVKSAALATNDYTSPANHRYHSQGLLKRARSLLSKKPSQRQDIDISRSQQTPRKLQTPTKFIFYGGMLHTSIDGSTMEAEWDGAFYVIRYGENQTNFDLITVEYGAENSLQFLVAYFPPGVEVDPETDLPLGTTFTNVLMRNGFLGFVVYSADEGNVVTRYTLYTYDRYNRLSETALSAGGSIAPALLVDAGDGEDNFLFGSAYPWNTNGTALELLYMNYGDLLSSLNLSTVQVEMLAYDYDSANPDVPQRTPFTFEVPPNGTVPNTPTVGSPTLSPGPTSSSSPTSSPGPTSSPQPSSTWKKAPTRAPSNGASLSVAFGTKCNFKRSMAFATIISAMFFTWVY